MNSGFARILCLALVFTPVFCARGESDEKRKAEELSALRSRIQQTEAARVQTQEQLNAAMAEVRKHELAIAEAAGRLHRIESGIAGKTTTLKELTASKSDKQRELAADKQGLAEQVHAAYLIGRQDTLKLLLNQQDPQRVQRALAYHRYFTAARLQRLRNVQADIHDIDQLTLAIKLETDKLRQLQASQQQSLTEMDTLKDAREQATAKLQKQIATHDQALGLMRADAQKLEALLERLVRQAKERAATAESQFGKKKGRLSWPVQGRILRAFGDSRDGGEFSSRGVMIAARPGSEVHVVDAGQVIFADWFQSLGLLVIVDHGNGFMSLYGHNQTLEKAVGANVRGGETLATVGDSGGHADTGLYFEIRRNGVPVDPAKWCR